MLTDSLRHSDHTTECVSSRQVPPVVMLSYLQLIELKAAELLLTSCWNFKTM